MYMQVHVHVLVAKIKVLYLNKMKTTFRILQYIAPTCTVHVQYSKCMYSACTVHKMMTSA